MNVVGIQIPRQHVCQEDIPTLTVLHGVCILVRLAGDIHLRHGGDKWYHPTKTRVEAGISHFTQGDFVASMSRHDYIHTVDENYKNK